MTDAQTRIMHGSGCGCPASTSIPTSSTVCMRLPACSSSYVSSIINHGALSVCSRTVTETSMHKWRQARRVRFVDRPTGNLLIYPGMKNAGAYKRLLLTMESARQETEPTHREQVREQSIVALKDRIVKYLASLTTIHRNYYQVKSLRRIAGTAVDLFELLYFTPATYRLIPFNYTRGQHDQCEIFDTTMHDEIVPSDYQVLDGRPVYGMVFPGLMRQFDETGREVISSSVSNIARSSQFPGRTSHLQGKGLDPAAT